MLNGTQINDLPEFYVERAMGIEPTALAWEARVLPLYDARSGIQIGILSAEAARFNLNRRVCDIDRRGRATGQDRLFR